MNTDFDADDLESLSQSIQAAEADLAEMRKQYRERKTAKLKAAIEARDEADKAVRREMKALGMRYASMSNGALLY